MLMPTVAAFFSYPTTGKLLAAIARGEAPKSTATQLVDGRRVPVWALDACRKFIADRHGIVSEAHRDAAKEEDIGALI
jgi:hypothetical protein